MTLKELTETQPLKNVFESVQTYGGRKTPQLFASMIVQNTALQTKLMKTISADIVLQNVHTHTMVKMTLINVY